MHAKTEEIATAAALEAEANVSEAKMDDEQQMPMHDVVADVASMEDGLWASLVTPHIVACEAIANIVCALRDGKEGHEQETVEWESDDEDKMERVRVCVFSSYIAMARDSLVVER